MIPFRVLAVAAVAIAAGCSGAAPWGIAVPQVSDGATVSASGTAKAYLYVANYGNNTVTEYAPGSTVPMRTIDKGISVPIALALDAAGNLYVANLHTTGKGAVTMYAPGGTTPSRTISNGLFSPHSLAFDSSGNLYVGDSQGNGNLRYGFVTVYAPGRSSPLRRITAGISLPRDAQAMAFDSFDHLFVANYGGVVTEYASQSTRIIRSIRRGVANPTALTIDASNRLYVMNADGYVTPSITQYAAGSATPVRTIRPPKSVVAAALQAGANGELYLADFNSSTAEGNEVSVYGEVGTAPLRAIKNGVRTPSALAIDAAGNLYVANNPSQSRATYSVTVYAAGSTKLQRTISQGISIPVAITLGTQ